MTVDEGLELDAFEGQLKINRFFPEVMVIDVYWRYSIASFPGVPLWMKILLQSQATLMDA
ncbi:hypothetical protein KXX68_009217, partial [Aspergillus fumigatus]